MTKIKLILGNNSYTENDILYCEINKSVFLFGEYGTIVMNYKFKDIHQIPTTGTLVISDPINENKFSSPIEFILIGKLTFSLSNNQWILKFNWLNKYQVKQISTNTTKQYKNMQIHDIILNVVQDELNQKQNINNINNRYEDNPVIWYSNYNQLTFLKYLLMRQNPKENGFLLMYLLNDTVHIHIPQLHDVIDTISNKMLFTSENQQIKELQIIINSNFTIPRNVFQKNNVVAFDYTKEKEDDYYLKDNKTFKNVNDKLNKLFITPDVGYNENININTILSGEKDKNIIEQINSYLFNRMTFDNIHLKVKLKSKQIYDIDKTIQLNYYDDIKKPVINPYLSGKYYIQQLKRVFMQKNLTLQLQNNMFNDETVMILVKNDLNIKQR